MEEKRASMRRSAEMMLFIAERGGKGLGEAAWGDGDSLEGTLWGPRAVIGPLGHLEQVRTPPALGSVFSSDGWW